MGASLTRQELEALGSIPCSRRYSLEVPDTATEDSTPIRRSPDGAGPSLSSFGCRTLYEAFSSSVARLPKKPCLGWRPVDSLGQAAPFVFETYSEVAFRVRHFGAGLEHLGLLNPNERGIKMLGIYSPNRKEWFVAEQACYSCRAATVPFYDSLGADALTHILNETGLSTILTTAKNLEKVLDAKAQCPGLCYVILMDRLSAMDRHVAGQVGISLYSFAQVSAVGEDNPRKNSALPAQPHDIATFCYTSGTTGKPKGALLTHENLISGSAALFVFMGDAPLGENDVHLSYLPLPHVFERLVQLCIYSSGGRIGYFRGNPLTLFEDVAALHPTFMALVPRVMNKLYDKIMTATSEAPTLKASLFRRALRAKLQGLRRGLLTHDVWDPLVFNNIKKALGFDAVRLMVTGSAPVAAHVLSFIRVLVGVPLVEGYGQTESSGVTSITFLNDHSTGHVGAPVPSVEIKLVSVPEMGYFNTDNWHGPRGKGGFACLGRGEVCIRGPSVFTRYYEGESPVDVDGWLHSGDIGVFNESGALVLVDRIKNVFKLAQGEFVSTEVVESAMQKGDLLAQTFVYGDSLKSFLVAVVVPNFETWCAKSGLPESREITSELVAALVSQVRETMSGLPKFMMPKKMIVTAEEFTVENGLLTPTFKMKRKLVADKYMRDINLLYSELSSSPPVSSGYVAELWVKSKL